MQTWPMDRGVLIAFEGIDGAGKTTQAHELAADLRSIGFQVVTSKEPTDGPWGQKIRESARSGRMSPEEELHAFMEDRRAHVANLIQPALDAGKVVIVDRYYFSTVAYQGARGMDPAALLAQNEEIAPRPDVVVLLTIGAEDGLARVDARGTANEFETIPALKASASIFDLLGGPHIIRVDGRPAVADVHAAVARAVHGPGGVLAPWKKEFAARTIDLLRDEARTATAATATPDDLRRSLRATVEGFEARQQG